jgi:ABC-type hemin transport system ATPase subunit
MITLNNLSARIVGRLLIDQATVALPAGIKAGLVGKNGAGKSTLFKIITGDLAAEIRLGLDPCEARPYRAAWRRKRRAAPRTADR